MYQEIEDLGFTDVTYKEKDGLLHIHASFKTILRTKNVRLAFEERDPEFIVTQFEELKGVLL